MFKSEAMKSRADSFVFILVLLLTNITCAADTDSFWPQFHGPNRDNISTEKGLLKKWAAMIMTDGKPKFIGHFDDEIEAARAYDAAARELHGQFAALNFPEPRKRA